MPNSIASQESGSWTETGSNATSTATSTYQYAKLAEETATWQRRATAVAAGGVVAWLVFFSFLVAVLHAAPISNYEVENLGSFHAIYQACAVGWLVFTGLAIMGLLIKVNMASSTSYLKTLCIGAGIVMTSFYTMKALNAVPTPVGSDGGPVYLPRAMAWAFARSFLIFALWASSESSTRELQWSLGLDWAMLSTGVVAGFTIGSGNLLSVAIECVSAAGLLYYMAVMFNNMAKACRGFPKARTSVRRLQIVHMVSWSIFPIINLLDKLGVLSRYQLEIAMAMNEFVAFALFAEAMGQGVVKVSSDRKTGRLQERSLELVKQLREADKRKDRFFAAMSHELRTPLNGIIGLTDSLLNSEKDHLTEKATRSLTTVLNTARRFGKLINTILDSASLKENKLQLSLVPVSLFQVVEEAVRLINPIVSTQVKLSSQIPANLPMLNADPNRLMQIMYNVLGNAAKFCTQGSITIRAMQVGSNMLIEVEDTGIGIPEDKMGKIFEAFEQVDNSQSRGYGGTGLGLNLALNLAKAHNGDLTARSAIGKGTTFTLTIPIMTEDSSDIRRGGQDFSKASKNEANDNEEDDAGEQPDKKDISTNATKKMRKKLDAAKERIRNSSRTVLNWMDSSQDKQTMVQPYMAAMSDKDIASPKAKELLSVDDDPVNQEVMGDLLSDCGYKITKAMSGIEALKILEDRFEADGTSSFPDMILMDNMMPGMTGLEATRKIREMYPMVEMPIIMVTANDDEETVCKALTGGANDFIKKPLRRSELKARVDLQLTLLDYYAKEIESRKQEQILKTILPPSIIERLSVGQTMIADELEQVTVLFSDIVGFTTLAAECSTPELVSMLDKLFSEFDSLTDSYGVQKIETIGDCYMVAAGHDEESRAEQATRMLNFATAMIDSARDVMTPSGTPLQIRIGIHTGPAYAGVVGQKIPRYCLFGDTINTASRMESTGFPGCIQISDSTYRLAMESPDLQEEVPFCDLGERLIKGKGVMQTWLVQEGMWEDGLNLHVEQQKVNEDEEKNNTAAGVAHSIDFSFADSEALSSVVSCVECIGQATKDIPKNFVDLNAKVDLLLAGLKGLHGDELMGKLDTPKQSPRPDVNPDSSITHGSAAEDDCANQDTSSDTNSDLHQSVKTISSTGGSHAGSAPATPQRNRLERHVSTPYNPEHPVTGPQPYVQDVFASSPVRKTAAGGQLLDPGRSMYESCMGYDDYTQEFDDNYGSVEVDEHSLESDLSLPLHGFMEQQGPAEPQLRRHQQASPLSQMGVQAQSSPELFFESEKFWPEDMVHEGSALPLQHPAALHASPAHRRLLTRSNSLPFELMNECSSQRRPSTHQQQRVSQPARRRRSRSMAGSEVLTAEQFVYQQPQRRLQRQLVDARPQPLQMASPLSGNMSFHEQQLRAPQEAGFNRSQHPAVRARHSFAAIGSHHRRQHMSEAAPILLDRNSQG